MKTMNLSELQLYISRVLVRFLVTSTLSLIIIFFVLMIIYRSQQRQDQKELIENANALLQINLADQITIIANDSNFFDYIHSGSVSREQNYMRMRMLFSSLDNMLIKSIVIKENTSGIDIFHYGDPTGLFANINLCYLNQKLDNNFGVCGYHMMIFFDAGYYIKHLKQINNNISVCLSDEGCTLLTPFIGKFFGSFSTSNGNQSKILLHYTSYTPTYLFLSYIFYFIVIIALWLISHSTIIKLVQFRLIKPISEIISNLKNGKMVPRGDESYVDELAYLLSVIHEYQKYQSNIQLSKLAAEVAHDIASPINAMSIVINNMQNTEIQKEYINILNNSIKNIKNITQNLLASYRNIGTTSLPINPVFEDACSIFRYVVLINIIETVIANKEVEWETSPCELEFYMDLPTDKVYWAYLSLAKLSTVISNLLNNAYDSLDKPERIIKIKLSKQNENFVLAISDNGCGIKDSKIKDVLLGTSLKQDGHGIGLSGAKHFFENISGTLSLESKFGVGTSVITTFPISIDPQWWESVIKYNTKSKIIILEDDIFTIILWQNKLVKLNIDSQYFSSANEFKEWYALQENFDNVIFISDYQIGDKNYNGMDIITWSGIKHAYLCTNYAEDASLQKAVAERDIKLIPKSLITKIKFSII